MKDSSARMLANDLVVASLGIAVTGIDEGTATATMTIRPEMTNGHGICHGGYVFLLADTALGHASNARGPATVTSGADIEFLAPVAVDEELVAVAAETVRRGRSGVYDVTVTRGDEVVAVLRGRSRALAP